MRTSRFATALVRATLIALPALFVAGQALAQTRAKRVAAADLPSYWVLSASASDALVPNSGKNLDVPVCVSVRYRIGSDGMVRDATLGKVVPESDLGPTAVKIVSHFQYKPGPSNPSQQAVDTWYTVQFNMRNLPEAEKTRRMAACDLPGYGR
ncbi:MAG TPA: energy transducer TonB [Rhodanobacteraceae bacterium]|nr:energy transducer TonB [Rhodanobacteraceae bacterium]